MKNCLKCRKALTGFDFYGLHGDCYRDWFKDPEMKGFTGWDLKKSGFSSFPDTESGKAGFPAQSVNSPSTFYHGRYRKYSAQIGPEKYILKVEEEKFPDLPEMEYICNRIAFFFDLKPAEHYLIRLPAEKQISAPQLKPAEQSLPEPFEKNPLKQKQLKEGSGFHTEQNDLSLATSPSMSRQTPFSNPGQSDLSLAKKAFVTRNFMQDLTGSLNHIYKFLPKGLKNYSCENIIKEIRRQTKHPFEEQKFVKICLFDSLIGNNDRHGRNLAFIDTGKNKRLAPIYDNPSLFGVEKEWFLSADSSISGCIQVSFSKEPKINDYVEEFKSLGQITACRQFLKKAKLILPKIIKEVEKSDFSQKRKLAFVKYIKKQLKTLEESLS